MLRAPVFIGLREDKNPKDVVREVAQAPPEAAIESNPGAHSTLLDLHGRQATVEIDGHPVRFTNLDKVFFPRDGWTKRDLLAFYDRVSPWLLPHLKDRPLSMKRYPDGITGEFFFQKDAPRHFPDWIRCEPIREGHPPKTNHYPLANDRASLLYLVDLDSVEASFDLIVDAALLIRELLESVGLRGYPKTTGGDGMHVYVPLDPVYTYDQVRSFAEILAHLAAEQEPNLFTTPRTVEKRKKGRVYFDYLQIGTGKTIAAPYVVRAHDGAPVSTPLDWKEVKRGLRPSDFRMDNVIERFERKGDLFAPVLAGGQKLEEALARIEQRAQPPATGKKTTRRKTSTAKAHSH